MSDAATPSIRVVVRDGRSGRDLGKVVDGHGEVLDEFDSDHPIQIGEVLTLPDGETVTVIGISDRMDDSGWWQTVDVGNVWSS